METTTVTETEPVIDATNILQQYERVDLGVHHTDIKQPQLDDHSSDGPGDEQNGEPINDSLYERDRILEDYYNIDIKYIVSELDKEANDRFNKEVLSGETSFDFSVNSVFLRSIHSTPV